MTVGVGGGAVLTKLGSDVEYSVETAVFRDTSRMVDIVTDVYMPSSFEEESIGETPLVIYAHGSASDSRENEELLHVRLSLSLSLSLSLREGPMHTWRLRTAAFIYIYIYTNTCVYICSLLSLDFHLIM